MTNSYTTLPIKRVLYLFLLLFLLLLLHPFKKSTTSLPKRQTGDRPVKRAHIPIKMVLYIYQKSHVRLSKEPYIPTKENDVNPIFFVFVFCSFSCKDTECNPNRRMHGLTATTTCCQMTSLNLKPRPNPARNYTKTSVPIATDTWHPH